MTSCCLQPQLPINRPVQKPHRTAGPRLAPMMAQGCAFARPAQKPLSGRAGVSGGYILRALPGCLSETLSWKSPFYSLLPLKCKRRNPLIPSNLPFLTQAGSQTCCP